MNIIFVYQTDPFESGQGGGVRHVKNLLNGIQSQCESILFLGVGNTDRQEGNVALRTITPTITGYVPFLLRLAMKIAFTDTSRYDIVHVHRLYFAIPFIIFKPKLKIVCTLHGRTFSLMENKLGPFFKVFAPILKAIEKFCIPKIDYILPVSMDVVKSFTEKYRNFPTMPNMAIIAPMVEPADYRIVARIEACQHLGISDAHKYIGFVGRLSDVKDISFLLNFAHEYRNHLVAHNTKMLIFGTGEDAQNLKALQTKLHLEELVVFHGEINPADVLFAMGLLETLLISSKHESGPIVMKEALLCGIPVVSNDVGEVRDYIIDGVNGFVVEKNSASYLSAVQAILENPMDKEAVRQSCLTAIKDSGAAHQATSHLKIYNALLQQ